MKNIDEISTALSGYPVEIAEMIIESIFLSEIGKTPEFNSIIGQGYDRDFLKAISLNLFELARERGHSYPNSFDSVKVTLKYVVGKLE